VVVLIRALLLFWAIWFSVVTASNGADLLREAGLLSPDWRFASGNYSLVAESVALYSVSRAWASALFALVLVAQLTASALFWRAALDASPFAPRARPGIMYAFLAGIGLFSAFLVFDEVLLIYRRLPNLETAHFAILCALLLSLSLIHLLGEGGEHRA
jgi:hypothetical protein